ncbi:MAG: RNA polymerase sigma factor SigM [Acidimicrobiia bacterium]|nr:MAG: RNA polymerase sigma factor SigM [Acidimicrobiia bacterium]
MTRPLPVSEMADADLMGRVAARDGDAFTELMRRHEDLVFRVALRMVKDREVALDVAQDVFTTLWRKAGRWRGDSAVTTWLYRVTVNASIDTLRRLRRRRAEPLPDTHDPADPRGEDPFRIAEFDLEEALSRLPVDFRTVIVLADVEGLPLAEVARLLDLPVGTVKSRLFRARRLLQPVLGNPPPSSTRPT